MIVKWLLLGVMFMISINLHDTSATDQSLKRSLSTEKDLKCLASAIYHEARGESLSGQVQVAAVVLERTKVDMFPDNICGVVFQHKQFSGLKRIKYDAEAFLVATKVYKTELVPTIKGATFYHTTAIKPYWAKSKMTQKVGVIGAHVFYRIR